MKKRSVLSQCGSRLQQALGSRWLWRVAVGWFVIQAGYIALTGQFSMAFDEFFHFQAIQAYAKTWLPWQVQQPPGPAELGAFTTDGSYLYHYLMSWPYRFAGLFVHSETIHIVVLRLFDIGLVVAGLYVYRRLLLRLGMSRWTAQLTLFFLMALPVTAFLAGQVTYDTLFFVATGLTLSMTIVCMQAVRRHSTLPLTSCMGLVALMVFTIQIKYAFVPIALAITLYGGWWAVRQVRARRIPVWQRWRLASQTGLGLCMLGVVLLSGVFFMQRYGMNMVRYGSLMPDCAVVLGRSACLAFDPYGRDESYRASNYRAYIARNDIVQYPVNWSKQMMRELYFTVGPRQLDYPPGAPLPVAYAVGWVVALGSGVWLVLRSWMLLKKSGEIRLILIICGVYVGFLFAKNFGAYLHTGVPVAIHGRYVLPLLPLAGYILYVSGLPRWIPRRALSQAGILASGGLLAGTIYGGGFFPFILRSTDAWYWSAAVPISRVVRAVFWPLILQ